MGAESGRGLTPGARDIPAHPTTCQQETMQHQSSNRATHTNTRVGEDRTDDASGLLPPIEQTQQLLSNTDTKHTMNPLREYTRHGITRRITHRRNNVAIASGKHDFEVIIIQSHQGRIIAGNEIPPSEYPPSSEQWGCKGWTYRTLDEAIEKYKQL